MRKLGMTIQGHEEPQQAGPSVVGVLENDTL
jgi:hypothetical protein